MHCPALVMVTKVVAHRLSEDLYDTASFSNTSFCSNIEYNIICVVYQDSRLTTYISTTRSSSSAIVFAVVAALIPSISATPINAGTDQCPSSCTSDEQCWECFFGVCVSINRFPRFDTRLTCMKEPISLQSELYFFCHIDAVWDVQIASDWSS